MIYLHILTLSNSTTKHIMQRIVISASGYKECNLVYKQTIDHNIMII